MASVVVYLKYDIDKLGRAGQRVTVKNGYARNFLIPRNLAVPVTKKSINRLDNAVRQVESRRRIELKAAQSVAEMIGKLECSFVRQSGEEGRIFGSVTVRDIAAAIKEEGLDIDYRKIQLERPIRSLGIHQVPIRVHQDVVVELKVWVKKEEVEESSEPSQ